MTLEEAQSNVGALVDYVQLYGASERGRITEVRDRLVFVLYFGDRTAKATSPEDLVLAES